MAPRPTRRASLDTLGIPRQARRASFRTRRASFRTRRASFRTRRASFRTRRTSFRSVTEWCFGLPQLLLSSQEQKLARLKKRAGWLRRCILTPQTFHGLRVNHPDGTVETIEIPELREFWKREVEGNAAAGGTIPP